MPWIVTVGVASPTGTALLGLTAKPPKMRWMRPLVAYSSRC